MTILLLLLLLVRISFENDLLLSGIILMIFSLLLKPYSEELKKIFIYSDWYSTYLSLIQKGKIKKTDRVRISFDRLYRIKSKGKYYLYFNKKYQKYMALGSLNVYSNKSKSDFIKINAIQDNNVKGNEFKFTVPSQNLGKLISKIKKNFPKSKVNYYVTKDFLHSCEINKIQLKKDNIVSIDFQGRIESNLEYSRLYQQYEMKFYDIYNVKLNQEGIEFLNENNDTLWVTEKKIYSNGSDPENQIYSENIHNNVYRILEQESKNYIKF
jgi:hypothetical protein